MHWPFWSVLKNANMVKQFSSSRRICFCNGSEEERNKFFKMKFEMFYRYRFFFCTLQLHTCTDLWFTYYLIYCIVIWLWWISFLSQLLAPLHQREFSLPYH
jgi:hypothetical protein